jgi:hypothetical protein
MATGTSDPFYVNLLRNLFSPKLVSDGDGGYQAKVDLVNVDNIVYTGTLNGNAGGTGSGSPGPTGPTGPASTAIGSTGPTGPTGPGLDGNIVGNSLTLSPDGITSSGATIEITNVQTYQRQGYIIVNSDSDTLAEFTSGPNGNQGYDTFIGTSNTQEGASSGVLNFENYTTLNAQGATLNINSITTPASFSEIGIPVVGWTGPTGSTGTYYKVIPTTIKIPATNGMYFANWTNGGLVNGSDWAVTVAHLDPNNGHHRILTGSNAAGGNETTPTDIIASMEYVPSSTGPTGGVIPGYYNPVILGPFRNTNNWNVRVSPLMPF